MKAAIPRNRRGKQLHRPVDGEEGSTTSTKQEEAQHQSKEGEKGKQRHPEGGGIRQHHPQRRRTAAPGEGNAAFLWVALAPPFFFCVVLLHVCGAAVTIGVFGVVLLSPLLLWIGTAFTIFLDPDICRVLLRIGAFFRCGLWQPKKHIATHFHFSQSSQNLDVHNFQCFCFRILGSSSRQTQRHRRKLEQFQTRAVERKAFVSAMFPIYFHTNRSPTPNWSLKKSPKSPPTLDPDIAFAGVARIPGDFSFVFHSSPKSWLHILVGLLLNNFSHQKFSFRVGQELLPTFTERANISEQSRLIWTVNGIFSDVCFSVIPRGVTYMVTHNTDIWE